MKYAVMVHTEIWSRIVIESKTDIAQLLPGPEKGRFIKSLEKAAVNYNAQNDIAARDWRDGHFTEEADFQGETHNGNPDLNLEEWDEEG